MPHFVGLAVAVVCCLLSFTASLNAQTPMRWLAHDMQRERPRVVTPGKLSLPVAPPSDAIVIFDGQDLSNWRDAEGGPAKWRMSRRRDGIGSG